MTNLKLPIVVFFLLNWGGTAWSTEVPQLSDQQRRNWIRFWEEQQGDQLIVDFSRRVRSETTGIVGATVIPMNEETALEGYTVVVREGTFSAIGPSSEIDVEGLDRVIDATGLFLIPGLTEAHSHTISSLSQFLVYLTRGVTTLREMDGYPWMLQARKMAVQNRLLIPNLYLTGHILSHRAWDFYMTQVDTEEQARELVRAQVSAGYDFIKIHNSMPQPMFGAILDEANAAGVDVVGHIPNEITIAEAVAAGMRTNEHFKGYIFDETLDITDQDYVTATSGSDLWNVPTFATYHDHLRGQASLELVTQENSLQYVPRWLRRSWLEQAEQPVDRLTTLRQSVYPKSQAIFSALWPVTQKFVAGTDTGTYAMMVPGYALQEEVRIFESLGLTPYEALQTATIKPGLAMRKGNEYGTIEVGKRADFVLLGSDPLLGMDRLADIQGVCVRGVYLDEEALQDIRDRVAHAFSDANPVPHPSRESLEALVAHAQSLVNEGFPYPDYSLQEIQEFVAALDQADLEARLGELR